jgi:large subunit ribosomal protein L21
MFAVFEAKGFQYLGGPGEKLKIPRLDSKIGEKVTFDKVLLVKNGDTKIGQPYIEGASITAKIVDHGRYKKIIVFKFKKRNRYKRTRGHRQTYTEIEIKDVILGGKAESKKLSKKEEAKAERKSVAKAEVEKTSAEKKTTGKAKKKATSAKKAKKTTKKTAKTKKATTKKKKTSAKPKKSSAKAKKTKKSTSKTKKEKK